MDNSRPQEVEKLFSRKLDGQLYQLSQKIVSVGFNNRKYDNHICYAAYLGYNNGQLYQLSHLYDLCQKKQSLKKLEIEFGIHHRCYDT